MGDCSKSAKGNKKIDVYLLANSQQTDEKFRKTPHDKPIIFFSYSFRFIWKDANWFRVKFVRW